ncbi:MAG: Crp/Fnr family transcriptional regulator [Flavobacteriales bacterium]|nr:Crp/Fnr family transcriptional regulator [Flavobacteriales bacterium]MCB9190488.1 Crp/Fnr family transcriptional regulator [Flavobacteriales bacterium]
MENVIEKVEGAIALQSFIQGIVNFSDSEMELIMSRFEPMSLPAGEYFVDEGLVCKHIGFIVKGYVRSYYEINEGEVTTMINTKHNIVTAHTSFTLQRPSMQYIQAITDSELLVMSYESMQELYDRIPKWDRLGRIINEHVYGYVEGRVVDYLSLSPEERYRKLIDENAKLVKNVPLRYVASMLGITPETLSRIRNKVKKEEA